MPHNKPLFGALYFAWRIMKQKVYSKCIEYRYDMTFDIKDSKVPVLLMQRLVNSQAKV